MLNNIRIILVSPSHPGNIGAVARAMKTMELEHLYLVNPKIFPHVNATALAAGADDLLERAIITTSLKEALTDSEIVFGTSARIRALPLPTLDPKTAAKFIINEAKVNTVSIVFGRESNGLSNEELELCNQQLYIPSNPNFSSLNIAAAVQLIAYEIKMANQTDAAITAPTVNLANTEAIQSFYQHLQQTLITTKFLNLKNLPGLMAKLKRLFNRAQLEKTEISILRGALTSINTALNKEQK